EAGPGKERRYICHRGLPEQCSHGWMLSRVTTYMNARPPRDISHAEQRSRSREDVPGGAARLPLALRPRPVGQPRPQLLQAGNGAVIAVALMSCATTPSGALSV